jgi:hypothetical protein
VVYCASATCDSPPSPAQKKPLASRVSLCQKKWGTLKVREIRWRASADAMSSLLSRKLVGSAFAVSRHDDLTSHAITSLPLRSHVSQMPSILDVVSCQACGRVEESTHSQTWTDIVMADGCVKDSRS